MGLSFGTTSNNSQSQASQQGTYSAGQSSLQNSLMQAFSSLLPGITSGSLSPNVQNMETANANQINQNYSSVGQKMNRFLAARGFGQSGQTGQVATQTELSRQGALGANASNASGQQLSLDQSLLTDSLLAAFNKIGTTDSQTGSGSSTSFGAQAAASIGF